MLPPNVRESTSLIVLKKNEDPVQSNVIADCAKSLYLCLILFNFF